MTALRKEYELGGLELPWEAVDTWIAGSDSGLLSEAGFNLQFF